MNTLQPVAPCAFTGWLRRHLPYHNLPYLQGLVLLVLYTLAFIPAFTIFANSPLRYITYAVPVGNLFIWFLLSPRQLQYDTRFVLALAIYTGLLMFAGLVTLDTFDKLTWINALRPVFYLLMFVPFMLFNLNSLRFLVLLFAGTMLLQSVLGTTTTYGGFSFSESQGLLESGLAFPLGAILLFCIRYKRRFTTALVALLFLAAFKRVSMVAVVTIMGFMVINMVISRLSGIRESYLALFTALLVAAIAVLLNLFYYEFFTLLADILGIKKSVVTLTMGRMSEFTILDMQTGEQSLMEILFGGGPGFATRNLIEVTIDYPLQIHNSYLLYYYDFGVIGFAVLMAGFLIIYSRNAFGLYLFAYNAFIMITDNSYTQHYHQFACFVLIAIAQTLEKEKTLRR